MPGMVSARLLGHRVVIRYRRAEGGPQPLSDVVGELTALTSDTVTVRTRAGEVSVPQAAITAARAVAANRRDILQLARVERLGWRAAELVERDGWLLSADRGWTGRANSALPLSMQQPLDELLATAGQYYAERGLPLQIMIPLPARGLLDAQLARRCWPAQRPTLVLVRSLSAAMAASPADVTLAERPGPDWLAGSRYRGGALPDFAVDLLTRHDRVRFASVYRDGQLAGMARGTVDEGWLGVSSVQVRPEFRRQGLAGGLMAALAAWGAAQGAGNCYLQVDADNEPALRLYGKLGFTEHHRYHYRLQPGAAASASAATTTSTGRDG